MVIIDFERHRSFVENWCKLRKIRKDLLSLGVQTVTFAERPAPPESFNLLLVLAYSLLDDVLNEYVTQGEFTLTRRETETIANGFSLSLAKKMQKSQNILLWVDYDHIDVGREIRNDLAHQFSLASKIDCLEYMTLIEQELISWEVLIPWTWWEYRMKIIKNNSYTANGPFYRAHKEQGHHILENVEDTPASSNNEIEDITKYYWRPLHGYKVADEFFGFPPEKHKR